MAESNGQDRPLPPAPATIIGPIAVAPAIPTYSALGNCSTLQDVWPGEVKIVSCILTPPVQTDMQDVVLATVSTGTANVNAWVLNANAPRADDFDQHVVVDVALQSVAPFGPVRATVKIAATIFYVPKTTTPVAATTGAD